MPNNSKQQVTKGKKVDEKKITSENFIALFANYIEFIQSSEDFKLIESKFDDLVKEFQNRDKKYLAENLRARCAAITIIVATLVKDSDVLKFYPDLRKTAYNNIIKLILKVIALKEDLDKAKDRPKKFKEDMHEFIVSIIAVTYLNNDELNEAESTHTKLLKSINKLSFSEQELSLILSFCIEQSYLFNLPDTKLNSVNEQFVEKTFSELGLENQSNTFALIQVLFIKLSPLASLDAIKVVQKRITAHFVEKSQNKNKQDLIVLFTRNFFNFQYQWLLDVHIRRSLALSSPSKNHDRLTEQDVDLVVNAEKPNNLIPLFQKCLQENLLRTDFVSERVSFYIESITELYHIVQLSILKKVENPDNGKQEVKEGLDDFDYTKHMKDLFGHYAEKKKVHIICMVAKKFISSFDQIQNVQDQKFIKQFIVGAGSAYVELLVDYFQQNSAYEPTRNKTYDQLVCYIMEIIATIDNQKIQEELLNKTLFIRKFGYTNSELIQVALDHIQRHILYVHSGVLDHNYLETTVRYSLRGTILMIKHQDSKNQVHLLQCFNELLLVTGLPHCQLFLHRVFYEELSRLQVNTKQSGLVFLLMQAIADLNEGRELSNASKIYKLAQSIHKENDHTKSLYITFLVLSKDFKELDKFLSVVSLDNFYLCDKVIVDIVKVYNLDILSMPNFMNLLTNHASAMIKKNNHNPGFDSSTKTISSSAKLISSFYACILFSDQKEVEKQHNDLPELEIFEKEIEVVKKRIIEGGDQTKEFTAQLQSFEQEAKTLRQNFKSIQDFKKHAEEFTRKCTSFSFLPKMYKAYVDNNLGDYFESEKGKINKNFLNVFNLTDNEAFWTRYYYHNLLIFGALNILNTLYDNKVYSSDKLNENKHVHDEVSKNFVMILTILEFIETSPELPEISDSYYELLKNSPVSLKKMQANPNDIQLSFSYIIDVVRFFANNPLFIFGSASSIQISPTLAAKFIKYKDKLKEAERSKEASEALLVMQKESTGQSLIHLRNNLYVKFDWRIEDNQIFSGIVETIAKTASLHKSIEKAQSGYILYSNYNALALFINNFIYGHIQFFINNPIKRKINGFDVIIYEFNAQNTIVFFNPRNRLGIVSELGSKASQYKKLCVELKGYLKGSKLDEAKKTFNKARNILFPNQPMQHLQEVIFQVMHDTHEVIVKDSLVLVSKNLSVLMLELIKEDVDLICDELIENPYAYSGFHNLIQVCLDQYTAKSETHHIKDLLNDARKYLDNKCIKKLSTALLISGIKYNIRQSKDKSFASLLQVYKCINIFSCGSIFVFEAILTGIKEEEILNILKDVNLYFEELASQNKDIKDFINYFNNVFLANVVNFEESSKYSVNEEAVKILVQYLSEQKLLGVEQTYNIDLWTGDYNHSMSILLDYYVKIIDQPKFLAMQPSNKNAQAEYIEQIVSRNIVLGSIDVFIRIAESFEQNLGNKQFPQLQLRLIIRKLIQDIEQNQDAEKRKKVLNGLMDVCKNFYHCNDIFEILSDELTLADPKDMLLRKVRNLAVLISLSNQGQLVEGFEEIVDHKYICADITTTSYKGLYILACIKYQKKELLLEFLNSEGCYFRFDISREISQKFIALLGNSFLNLDKFVKMIDTVLTRYQNYHSLMGRDAIVRYNEFMLSLYAVSIFSQAENSKLYQRNAITVITAIQRHYEVHSVVVNMLRESHQAFLNQDFEKSIQALQAYDEDVVAAKAQKNREAMFKLSQESKKLCMNNGAISMFALTPSTDFASKIIALNLESELLFRKAIQLQEFRKDSPFHARFIEHNILMAQVYNLLNTLDANQMYDKKKFEEKVDMIKAYLKVINIPQGTKEDKEGYYDQLRHLVNNFDDLEKQGKLRESVLAVLHHYYSNPLIIFGVSTCKKINEKFAQNAKEFFVKNDYPKLSIDKPVENNKSEVVEKYVSSKEGNYRVSM